MPRRTAPPLLIVLALTAGGCASLTGEHGLTGSVAGLLGEAETPVRTATAAEPVVTVAALWKPAEGTGPAGTPVRGFAGNILLFNPAGPDPVVADGVVTIYLFSDAGTRAQQAVPIAEHTLTPAQWRTHLALSTLGPGYDVFVPYPERHGRAVRCSLRVRFVQAATDEHGETRVGQPLFSPSVDCALDGTRAGGPEFPPQGHAMTTETIVPDAAQLLRDDRRAPRRDAAVRPVGAVAGGGVFPASAQTPAGAEVPGLERLSPEARARVAQALAAFRPRGADDAARPDLSAKRSPFAAADGPADRFKHGRRFRLSAPRPGASGVEANAAAADDPAAPADPPSDPFAIR